MMNYIMLHNHIDSQQQVAQILGVARPSLNRAISELIAEGNIEVDGKNIKFLLVEFK